MSVVEMILGRAPQCLRAQNTNSTLPLRAPKAVYLELIMNSWVEAREIFWPYRAENRNDCLILIIQLFEPDTFYKWCYVTRTAYVMIFMCKKFAIFVDNELSSSNKIICFSHVPLKLTCASSSTIILTIIFQPMVTKTNKF